MRITKVTAATSKGTGRGQDGAAGGEYMDYKYDEDGQLFFRGGFL